MRSDRNLHGLMMFADDAAICSESREQVDEALPIARRNKCVQMRGTRAKG